MHSMIGFRYTFFIMLKDFIDDVSALGGVTVYSLVVLATILLGEYDISYKLITSLLLIFVSAYSIKLVYANPRPDSKKRKLPSLLERLNESSFPSVHVARISVLSVCMYSVFPALLYLSVLLIFLVGYSRVSMKRHYVSDVVAGVAIGFLIGYFIFVK